MEAGKSCDKTLEIACLDESLVIVRVDQNADEDLRAIRSFPRLSSSEKRAAR